jgi:hypothetical protein
VGVHQSHWCRQSVLDIVHGGGFSKQLLILSNGLADLLFMCYSFLTPQKRLQRDVYSCKKHLAAESEVLLREK